MNIHNNARLTPVGRKRPVQQVESGQALQSAAKANPVPGGGLLSGSEADRERVLVQCNLIGAAGFLIRAFLGEQPDTRGPIGLVIDETWTGRTAPASAPRHAT